MPLNPAAYATASALVRGAELHLRSAALFDDRPGLPEGKRFGRQPAPGKPPPGAGQWYVALHWGGLAGADKNPVRHDAYHTLTLTLTVQLGYAPDDRRGWRLTTPGDVYDLCDALCGPDVVHGSWALLAEGNKLIPGTEEYLAANGLDPGDATERGFVEPLVLLGAGPERPEAAAWVGAKTAGDVRVVDVRFGQARRLRYLTAAG